MIAFLYSNLLPVINWLKLLRNGVKVNRRRDLFIGRKAGLGRLSKILFSSEDNTFHNQSISIGNFAGFGQLTELHVWNNNRIVIKDHSTLNDGCKILGDVVIERYCVLSANIFASSGNHYATRYPTHLIKSQDELVLSTAQGRDLHSRKIHVEEDCWLGYGVFIKQGVYIGRGAIVGANSVVIKDVPPYSIQAGSPCKEIKKRIEFNPPSVLEARVEHLPYFYRGFFVGLENLNQSLPDNIIFASQNSMLVCQAADFQRVVIIGKYFGKPDLTLYVACGTREWYINVPEGAFRLELNVKAAGRITSKPLIEMQETVRALDQFNIFSIHLQGERIENTMFGISSLMLEN